MLDLISRDYNPRNVWCKGADMQVEWSQGVSDMCWHDGIHFVAGITGDTSSSTDASINAYLHCMLPRNHYFRHTLRIRLDIPLRSSVSQSQCNTFFKLA